VCAGTTQWQPHYGGTSSTYHMAAIATYGRAPLHDMWLPNGNMTPLAVNRIHPIHLRLSHSKKNTNNPIAA